MTGIKQLRMKACISQLEFAKQIGQLQQTVSKWERGRGCPKADILFSIAKALKVSVQEVVECFDEVQNESDT